MVLHLVNVVDNLAYLKSIGTLERTESPVTFHKLFWIIHISLDIEPAVQKTIA